MRTAGSRRRGEIRFPLDVHENKDIGINIALTPHLNGDASVGLEINQEVNDLLSYDADRKVADFAHKTLTSNVTLGNGQTVALGGYIQSSDRVNRKSVPGLGDLPLVGRYFNRDLKTVEKVEVIVFITPKILTDTRPLTAGIYRRRLAQPRQERLVDRLERDFVERSKFYPGHVNRRARNDAARRAALPAATAKAAAKAPARSQIQKQTGRGSAADRTGAKADKTGGGAPSGQPLASLTGKAGPAPKAGKVPPPAGVAPASPPAIREAVLADRAALIEEMRARVAARVTAAPAATVQPAPTGVKGPAKGAASPAKVRTAHQPSGSPAGARR